MIIRFPTALYNTVIPSAPDTPGNVTFTISSTTPPRATRTTIIIPPAIELKSWPEMVFTQTQRRGFLGDQVFTVAKSSVYSAVSGMKQHEVGEILEFGDEADSGLQPMVVSPDMEIRHDTNKLDYIGIGLTDDEIATIDRESNETYLITISELNSIRSLRSQSEADINHNKKQQNEVVKVLTALSSIGDSSTTADIKAKLESKLVDLQDEQSRLVAEANSLANQASELSDKLRNISQVVR